jgi:hypothetical protein
MQALSTSLQRIMSAAFSGVFTTPPFCVDANDSGHTLLVNPRKLY